MQFGKNNMISKIITAVIALLVLSTSGFAYYKIRENREVSPLANPEIIYRTEEVNEIEESSPTMTPLSADTKNSAIFKRSDDSFEHEDDD